MFVYVFIYIFIPIYLYVFMYMYISPWLLEFKMRGGDPRWSSITKFGTKVARQR